MNAGKRFAARPVPAFSSPSCCNHSSENKSIQHPRHRAYSCAMSLLSPPPGFPVHLVPVWPLIWLQILMLRAWVRATYGKGTQYHWSVTPCGRVFIASIDWIANQKSAPALLKPALHPNKRIAAALSGELLQPAYARTLLLSAHPGGLRRDQKSCHWHDFPAAGGPVRQASGYAALDPGFRRDERIMGLPAPET